MDKCGIKFTRENSSPGGAASKCRVTRQQRGAPDPDVSDVLKPKNLKLLRDASLHIHQKSSDRPPLKDQRYTRRSANCDKYNESGGLCKYEISAIRRKKHDFGGRSYLRLQ